MPQICLWWPAEAEREDVMVSEATCPDPGDDAESYDSSVNPTQSDEGCFRCGPENSSVKSSVADEVLNYLEGASKTLDYLNDFPRVKRLFLK
ncbi:uncharacterized protein AKAME5_001303100 [Lates japonicus]|uniref:Uncharacterized protein n=1 Tax=Lates japonicus TaxID=270547 RepID=A0AAD3RA05_LATJO|nr:uncharacterized protein AKAME5_001303100 [Lates japonicus]